MIRAAQILHDGQNKTEWMTFKTRRPNIEAVQNMHYIHMSHVSTMTDSFGWTLDTRG